MQEKNPRGKFITIEGLEGVGKSTNVSLVRNQLTDAGHEVIVTREPGGTKIGEGIRDLLLNPEFGGFDPKSIGMDPVAELLLIFAARRQHVAELIEPALRQGKWVVSDRFTDSSYAYQGGGRGLPTSLIADLERLSIDAFAPDLCILLDMNPGKGLARASQGDLVDRFEAESNEFFDAVREAFLARAKDSPRHSIVDASQPIAAVQRQITKIIQELLQG
ncbi:MAG: dTMP kinase [Pseudomonadales bacterium]